MTAGRGRSLDLVAVEALLVERLGGEVRDVEPVGGGAWSRAVAFRHDDRPLIVRFSDTDDDFRNDARAARLAGPGLPIPAVHDIGRAWDGWYAVSDRREGDYLEVCDAPTMRSRLPAVFTTLDAMRSADIGDTTGFGRWSRGGNGAHASWREALIDIAVDRPGLRIAGWRDRLATRPEATSLFRRAHRELAAVAVDLPDARHLVHSDLLNRNVLVGGTEISAVFDWGSALYGDFLFDVAWFAVWGPWFEGWGRIDLLAEARRHYADLGLDIPDFDRRLRACALYILLDGLAYLAWAGFDDALTWTARRTLAVLDGRAP